MLRRLVLSLSLSLIPLWGQAPQTEAPKASQAKKAKVTKAPALTQWKTEGLKSPSAIVWDSKAKCWILSCSPEGPRDKNGKGLLMKVDKEGKAQPWIEGLHSPKGMAFANKKLYVADVDEVAVIDPKEGSLLERIKLEGAKILWGVTANAKGDVYVSDWQQSALYCLPKGQDPELLLANRDLEGPKHLVLDGDYLYVAGYGVVTGPNTLQVETPGKFVRLDVNAKIAKPLSERPLGHLEGLLKLKEVFVATDPKAGKVFHLSAEGKATEAKEALPGNALAYDPLKRVLATVQTEAGIVHFQVQGAKTK